MQYHSPLEACKSVFSDTLVELCNWLLVRMSHHSETHTYEQLPFIHSLPLHPSLGQPTVFSIPTGLPAWTFLINRHSIHMLL